MNANCSDRDSKAATIAAVSRRFALLGLAATVAGCADPQGELGVSRQLAAVEGAFGDERRLEANDAAEADQFGYAVSLSGERALVGAYGESLYRGAAYVYVREGDAWVEEQKLFASDGAENDSFGWSVALGSDRLLVGAYARDAGRGAAYVFMRDAGVWLEGQKLVASDGGEGDAFGWSVALSGDRALVGAYGHDGTRGAAYAFAMNEGVWVEEQKLVASDGAGGDMLGYSVSLGSVGGLVGAPGAERARGAAQVFTRIEGSWAPGAKLVASDGADGDSFGISVSLAPGGALVGAYSDESLRGAAYVFSEDGGNYREQQKLTASDGASGHRFGNAVALSSERALVGAYASDDARGAVYFFARTDGTFSERQKLVASDGIESDFFGWSLAQSGDDVLVGAHYDDVLRGAAYVYSYTSGGSDPCGGDATADGGCAGLSETRVESGAAGCACATAGHPVPRHGWSFIALGVAAFRRRRRRARSFTSSLALAGLLALGCAGGGSGSAAGGSAAGGTDTGGTTATAGGAGTGGTGGGDGSCVGSHVVVPKRVVRLTEYQLFNAYAALFGKDAAAVITAGEDRPSIADRELPPIGADVAVSERFFARYDRLAQAAMQYVGEHSGTLTSCGTTPADATCVRAYLSSFAERAFRHPLRPEEESALLGHFWDEMVAAELSVAQALANGVYGILISPSFIYRTELGTDAAVDGPLDPYELATALSLFLTDSPPDEELLAAAATNGLATPDLVRAQATRMLETEGARRNLERALFNYFGFARASAVILNPEATPGLTLTSGIQSSIVHEGELFLQNVLWSEPLSALLYSRKTWTTREIATGIYGVAGPATVDSDGFGLVELAPDRAGLLTLSTFLLSGARSTGGSPVARGLIVNASILCAANAPFPEVVDPRTGRTERDPDVTAAIAMLSGESELFKAQYRASTPRCAGCHADFDAFGMVLEPYDAVGRLRTADLEGRPIDERWTTVVLPESVGGATVTSVAEAAEVLAASGAFERCMAMNFIDFALTEISRGGATNTDLSRAPRTGSCAVKGVIDRFETTDRTFSSLMREIAASDTLALRSKGR